MDGNWVWYVSGAEVRKNQIFSFLRVSCNGGSCYHRFVLRMQPDRTPAGGVAGSAAPAVEGSMPEDG